MSTQALWIDSHCHLADPRWEGLRAEQINLALAKGIGFFMQGGIGPEDWDTQLQIAKEFPDRIGLCFGLHPYWVADHSDAECEAGLDRLVRYLPKAQALGELGLDFRPHIMKDTRERQIDIFTQQLELAEVTERPYVLHIVQAHEEALRVLYMFKPTKVTGMVHSFNSSWGVAQEYLQQGLALSFGGPLARKDNKKLHQTALECPLEYMLLETDSPDQPPEKHKGQLNPLASLWDVASKMAELKKMTPFEILDISTQNFKRIFHF